MADKLPKWASAANLVFRQVGFAMRFEIITPDDAKRQLSTNPKLLKEYKLSQMMAGDANEESVFEGNSRPHHKTLIDRIKADKWRWYFGVIARCGNGAVIDGVTRLIAIQKAGKTVLALTYNAADPEDSYMFDDENSGRSTKDYFRGQLNVPPEVGDILSVMVPKAAGTIVDKNGRPNWERLDRDKWQAFYRQNKTSLHRAADFVAEEKSQPDVVRKNLTAYMYFKYVSQPGTKNPQAAARLLQIYRDGLNALTPVDVQMSELKAFFLTNNRIHERNHAMPLFRRVLDNALEGKILAYKLVTDKKPGGGQVYRVVVAGDAPIGRPKKTKKKKYVIKKPSALPIVELSKGKELKHVTLKKPKVRAAAAKKARR